MDRAAQAAGMSKGACMYHFKNKRALHAALIEDYAAHLDGQMKRHEARSSREPSRRGLLSCRDSSSGSKTFEADSPRLGRRGVALLLQLRARRRAHEARATGTKALVPHPGAARSGAPASIRGHHGARGLLLYSQVRRQSALCGTQRRPTASSTKSSWARAPSEERRTSPDSRLPQACIVLRRSAGFRAVFVARFAHPEEMRIDFAVSPLRFFSRSRP